MNITHAAMLGLATLALTAASGLGAETLKLSQLPHIHGIGFDPADPGSFLLGTHGGLFRAKPDGTAIQVSADANDYMGFSLDPGSDRLIASGHPATGGGLGVIESTDGGTTWTQIAPGAGGPVDVHAMTVSRAAPKTMYGLHGSIQVSQDGGQSWSAAPATPDGVIDLAASSTEPDVVYAGTKTGLMRSRDRGGSWQQFGPAGIAVSLVEATPDGSLYAFFAGSGLFRLQEGKWSIAGEGFGDTVLFQLAADPGDPQHLLAVTEDSAVLQSRDGGKTWSDLSQ